MDERILMLLAGVDYRFHKDRLPIQVSQDGFERSVRCEYDFCDVSITTPLSYFTLHYKLNDDDYYEFDQIFSCSY